MDYYEKQVTFTKTTDKTLEYKDLYYDLCEEFICLGDFITRTYDGRNASQIIAEEPVLYTKQVAYVQIPDVARHDCMFSVNNKREDYEILNTDEQIADSYVLIMGLYTVTNDSDSTDEFVQNSVCDFKYMKSTNSYNREYTIYTVESKHECMLFGNLED